MLSCRQITRLASENLDRRLPLSRRLRLWLHVRMCRSCARYTRQLLALERMICHHYRLQPPPGASRQLSRSAISGIQSALHAALEAVDSQDSG